jgi:hypothetical protein
MFAPRSGREVGGMDPATQIMALLPSLPSLWTALDGAREGLVELGPGERVALFVAVWGALPLLGLPLPGRAMPRRKARKGWSEGTRWSH